MYVFRKKIKLLGETILMVSKPYFRKYKPQAALKTTRLVNNKSKVSDPPKFVFFKSLKLPVQRG